jgi:RNA polymerase sigma-70 factor (ECF subfamily)
VGESTAAKSARNIPADWTFSHAEESATPSVSQERFEAEALPHLKALYRAAYRMTSNTHDAEDLVQETFLRAYRAFHSFTPGSNIRAWLHRILQNARTDAFRRQKRAPATVELPDEGPAAPATPPASEAGNPEVARALARLPDVFRIALVLRDVEDLSYQEIASVLGIPIGTVMSRLHRGRALLRESLAGTRP